MPETTNQNILIRFKGKKTENQKYFYNLKILGHKEDIKIMNSQSPNSSFKIQEAKIDRTKKEKQANSQ